MVRALSDNEPALRKRGVDPDDPPYVAESRFGIWFLGTETWAEHVLTRAIRDLERLIKNRKPSYPVIVDVGCGFGRSFKLLHECFRPERMVGVDINPRMLEASSAEAARHKLYVEFLKGTGSRLPLPDESVDMVFCHQTFHHLVEQERAMREFHRVLKRDGLLMFAESTRAYIHSWIIRLLFRHPMEVQKSAPEYLMLIRAAGFEVDSESISYPYLWWSRGDLGIRERLLGLSPPAMREETLINVVAVRR
jgi:ubiquinone/menaquinone biosynthesis C-methylase UbiE